jgi:hypothetical protein
MVCGRGVTGGHACADEKLLNNININIYYSFTSSILFLLAVVSPSTSATLQSNNNNNMILRLFTVLFLMCSASVAVAAETVRVRFGDHPTYSRAVFEWKTLPHFSVTRHDKNITIRFDKKTDIPQNTMKRPLSEAFRDIKILHNEDAATTIILTTAKEIADLKTFTVDANKVVLDVFVADTKKTLKSAEIKALEPIEKLPSAVLEKSTPTPQKISKTQDALKAAENKPSSLQLVKNQELKPKETAPLEASPLHETDKQKESAEGVVKPASPDIAPLDAITLNVKANLGANALNLSFPWQQDTAAAVFKRAGYTWLIFNRPARLDFSEIRGAPPPFLTFLEQRPVQNNATIIRLQIPPHMNLSLWRKGTTWNVDIRPQEVRPEVSVEVVAEPLAVPTPRILLGLPSLETPLKLFDPNVGDYVWLAPAISAIHGNIKERRFPDFTLLQTPQGLAIVPQSENVLVVPTKGGLAITSTVGLQISATLNKDNKINPFLPSDQKILLDSERWRQDSAYDFFTKKQRIARAISEAPISLRSPRRLELAQFLFAYQYLNEAQGIADAIVRDDAKAAQSLPIKFLNGAIQYLLGHPAAALNYFNDEAFASYPEIHLWRGAIFARLGKKTEALAELRLAAGIPASYPPRAAVALAIPIVEAYLADKDTLKTAQILDSLSLMDITPAQKERLAYLHARLLSTQGKFFESIKLLKKLVNSPDQWARTRSELALIALQLARKDIEINDAIPRLDRLRYAWRGDSFEFDVLERLGSLYLEQNDYRRGMRVLRLTISRFPEHPQKAAVEKQLQDTFKELYLESRADTMPPLTALALFDEFRTLTPTDDTGDEMIRQLADRLVAVDLLDRASDLLLHQIKERLSGVERARVGARLAIISLLDKNAGNALEALEISAVEEELSPELTQERLHLKARALMMQEKYPDALKLLEGDNSVNARQLRAEIFWAQKNYEQLIVTLRTFLTTPAGSATLEDDQAQTILNLALAFAFNQSFKDLEQLQKDYGAAMGGTPYAELFKLVAQTPNDTSFKNYGEISARFAEIQAFQNFLEGYRTRLKNEKLSAVN